MSDEKDVVAPKAPKDAKKVPLYAQAPFTKQTSRRQAVMGKLLEDNIMCRVLTGASSNDMAYEPKFEAQSHATKPGRVRRFGDIVGRLELHKSGTRAAASGTFPSNWRPVSPPNDAITKRGSASCGVAFERQITRKQDVNGKLLENLAMTRFLFPAAGGGPEIYDKAYDSMMQPLMVAHRQRIGRGQHTFSRQTGRLPLHRSGTRAAANGVFPSHWEPGMGYSETIPRATNVSNFGKQPGRCELHLSGMRGAPPNPCLAADAGSRPARPQSAMQMMNADAGADPKRRPATAKPDAGRPVPERVRKHIPVANFSRQMTRAQWCSIPLR